MYLFASRVAEKLGIPRWRVRDAMQRIVDGVLHWDSFGAAFRRRWQFVDPDDPILRYLTAVVDSTHVPIPRPADTFSQWFLWFDKPSYRGHALVFNVFINFGGEVIACSWWYSPKVSDHSMTQNMDSEIPWDFNGAQPDIRLGDLHYAPCVNMITRIGVRHMALFNAAYNQAITTPRIKVENVFSNIKKFKFIRNLQRKGGGYSYDFIAAMFVFACHLHNMELLWDEE